MWILLTVHLLWIFWILSADKPFSGEYFRQRLIAADRKWIFNPDINAVFTRERFHFEYNVSNALFGLPWTRFLTVLSNNTIEYKYLADYTNPCWLDDRELRCLPHFYVIGVGRSGTTMVYKLLTKHQNVVKPRRKELAMWQDITKRSEEGFDAYLQDFAEASCAIGKRTVLIGNRVVHNCVTFEGTPSYFCDQGNLTKYPGNSNNRAPTLTLAHTLYALNPRTKLIVMLRNPTDRLFSLYRLFTKKKGLNSAQFTRNIHDAVSEMRRCFKLSSVRQCVYDSALNKRIRDKLKIKLACSIYYVFAEDWLAVFPKRQVFFLKSEEFYNRTAEIVEEVFQFLEIDQPDEQSRLEIQDQLGFKAWKLSQKHADVYRANMSSKTRRFLDRFFLPFNIKLARLLGNRKFYFTRKWQPSKFRVNSTKLRLRHNINL